jgi:hypothetical protein
MHNSPIELVQHLQRKKKKKKIQKISTFFFCFLSAARERSSFSAFFFVLIVSLRFAKVPPSAPIYYKYDICILLSKKHSQSTMTLEFNRHLLVNVAVNTIEDGSLCKDYNVSTEKIDVRHAERRRKAALKSDLLLQRAFIGAFELTGDLSRLTALKSLDVSCVVGFDRTAFFGFSF